jgi:hypothetical protein
MPRPGSSDFDNCVQNMTSALSSFRLESVLALIQQSRQPEQQDHYT